MAPLTIDYDPKAATLRQKLYCQKQELPLFAPVTGLCWKCGMNIYYHYGKENSPAYTVSQAGNTHITGCPYCHGSFVD